MIVNGNTAEGQLEFKSSDRKYDYKIIHIPSPNLQVTGKWVLFLKEKTETSYIANSPYIIADYNPTSNCQLSLIGLACRLIELKNDCMMEVLGDFANLMRKCMILVDVNSSVATQFLDIFKDKVRLNSPYNSTNGSHMNILLIDVREFIK